MGNNQTTTTLEAAINKFCVDGGAGLKDGSHEYITPMGFTYVLVKKTPDEQEPPTP
jgi:hypothetical protein